MYLVIKSLSLIWLKLFMALAMVAAVSIAAAPSANGATRSCSSSTSTTHRPMLKSGDRGSCVKTLQHSLRSRSISVGSAGIDGDFGPGTRSAVVRFQRAHKLAADGIVGQQTWRALGGKTTSKPTSTKPATSGTCQPRRTIRSGSRGACVKLAQTKLNQHGARLSTDGDFGPATRSATVRYQRSAGLGADGIIGPATWRALDGGKVSTPTPPVSTSYNRSSGPNYTSRVVLTYDDCPKSLSQMKSLARSAAASNVGLVFFPTGNCISSGKFDANYARSYGHYVGNHSVSHPDLTTLSYSSARAQLRSPGVVTNYGRPPYGAINSTVSSAYSAEGMRPWTWNIDTRDWTGKSRSSVVRSAVSANRGDTVLMHMQWNGFSQTAINQIKSGLANKGTSLCRPHKGTAPRNLPNRLPC